MASIMVWHRSVVLVALGASCTGLTASRQEFVVSYCELLRPCCAQANLATDGVQCRAVLEAYTPRATYDAEAAAACLAGLRAAAAGQSFCQGGDRANQHACDEVFFPRSAGRGTVEPGQPCTEHEECAPRPEGRTLCHEQVTATARTRTCQVQIRGKEGDGPCLYTIPEVRSSFPYPDLVLVGAIPAVVQRFPRNSEPPPATPGRAYLCYVADGLTCSVTRTCARLGAAGSPCTAPSSCADGAFCDLASLTCQARKPPGASCVPERHADPPCVAGSYCDLASASCRPRVPIGAPCAQDEQCESGACVNDRCIADRLGSENAAMVCGRA
jgi:hypothetical protein